MFVFLDETMHQGKHSRLYYFNCYIANFYVLGLMYVSIYTCFEIRRRYYNIYIRRFLHDDLSKNMITSRVHKFLGFYNNSRLDLMGYVKHIEICNIIILILHNVTRVMCSVSMYHLKDNKNFILIIIISLFILDLYYLIINLIILKKTRVSRSLIMSLNELKRKRRVLIKIVVIDSFKENYEHEHIDQDYSDEIQLHSFPLKHNIYILP